jgi:hypothetical protein
MLVSMLSQDLPEAAMDVAPKAPVMEEGPAGGGRNRIRRFPGLGG